MTTEEFIEKGKAEYGRIFEDIMHYAAGILCRECVDAVNCTDILDELDNYSY